MDENFRKIKSETLIFFAALIFIEILKVEYSGIKLGVLHLY
jgi:hypothetical protein